jgi:regulator of sirC expression with transglutaminase-like and TPR domain
MKLLGYLIIFPLAVLAYQAGANGQPSSSPAAPTPATTQTRSTPAEAVRSTLSRPEARLDYLDAATNFDRLAGDHGNFSVTTAMISRLVDAARQMAGPNPTNGHKLAAIRRAIYEAGAWNYGRAFGYDRADPFGQILTNRLLSTYIRTRQGNCISMPTLFLVVADRMGLNVHLAIAPLHMLVRYSDSQGVDHNLETTSGGHEARDAWYRQNLPMTDRAIASGVYLRTLSRRESIAEMANVLLDSLVAGRRYQEAIDVADAILEVNPREAYTMVKKASAIAGLLQTEFVDRYPNPASIPVSLRSRYQMLVQQNQQLFSGAEALGWQPSE